MERQDGMDALLRRAAPSTVRSAEVDAAVAEMIADARQEISARPLRRAGRVVAIGAASALLIGGAGAAAAVSSGYWAPWAEQPYGLVRFAVPSGADCELRWGDLEAAPEVETAIREFFADQERVDAALVRVDEEIVGIRATPMTASDELGNSWDVGYGTEGYLSPDSEFKLAVDHAVGQALYDHLAASGLTEASGGSTSASQIWCSDGTFR